jgi:integrase
MAERRGRNEGSTYFEHLPGTAHKAGTSRDPENPLHRGCTGRWRGEVLVSNRAGKRVRKRVSAATKTELYQRLADLKSELSQGIRSSGTYTVQAACDDWLGSLTDKAPKTVQTQRELLAPLTAEIGKTVLRDLEADHVIRALQVIAETRSSRTVRDSRASLVRVITYAQARNLVARNVADLIKAPPGKAPGRPSKALTVTQALAVLTAAEKDRLHAYVVLSLLVGVRTEEARALRWDHVDLDGDQAANPPVPPHVDVWRSVRVHGDVKTRTSKRTLALPAMAVKALRAHREAQAREKAEMESVGVWHETGLVFTTYKGTAPDAANIRRSFRRICAAAGIGESWTPRDLRHSFVSIMSESGVPIEEIARLVGHAGGSSVTERVYRRELRPVLMTGAEVMDRLLAAQPKRKVRRPARNPDA